MSPPKPDFSQNLTKIDSWQQFCLIYAQTDDFATDKAKDAPYRGFKAPIRQ
tara:strand:+ start:282 stop:434 length:153 start_codon:yes stop_codon:yes gene_type:complete